MGNTNVLYAGPFDTFGVFKGGISGVVNQFYDYYLKANNESVNIIPFNTCTIKRTKEGQGRLSLENIRNSFNIYKGLMKSITNNKIDCLYYNSSAGMPLIKDLLILARIKKNTKIKVVVHIHFAELNKIFPKFKKMGISLFRKMDRIVLLSESTKSELLAQRIPEDKLSVVYNFHSFIFDEEDKENKIKHRDNKKLRLLYVGALSVRKGFIDLLKALKNVNHDFELNVCGEFTSDIVKEEAGPLIESFSKNLVKLHGYVTGEAKKQLYYYSDVLILPSYAEGLPLVIIEGLASGCCIVTTDVGANSEVICNENGFLFTPGDIGELASILNSLSLSTLNTIARKNFEKSSQFSIDHFYDNTIEVIEGLVSYD